MAFQFVQGRTNNHLTWVGVDATDAFTRERSLSNLWHIKIYGTLETAAGVNFVSSGIGSLTNDIVHIGASTTGVYHIALVKADLSDASAAWYDEYVVILSATGAAYETFVIEGVRTDTSALSNFLSNLSAISSDIYSALTLTNSRVLLTQSMASVAAAAASNVNSLLVTTGATLTAAARTAVASRVWSNTIGTRVDSRLVQTRSTASNVNSLLVTTGVTLTATARTAVASRVWSNVTGTSVNSRVLVIRNTTSDLGSKFLVMSDVLSDFFSDFQSRVPKTVATNSQLSDLQSDLRSYLVVMSGVLSDTYSALSDLRSYVLVGQSDLLSNIYSAAVQTNSRVLLTQSMASVAAVAASNANSLLVTTGVTLTTAARTAVASRVWSNTVGTRVDSRILVNQSAVSLVSTIVSDIYSALAAGTFAFGASNISDVASAVWTMKYTAASNVKPSTFGSLMRKEASGVSDLQTYLATISGILSDTYSAVSDLRSYVLVGQSDLLSNIYSAALQGNSRLLALSDAVSDLNSDLRSLVATTGVGLNVATMSDLKSAIAAGTGTVSVQNISDIASAVWAATVTVHGSAITAGFGALMRKTASGVSDTQSTLMVMSDILSGFYSDFQSRVPKRVATDSQLSDLHSDLRSQIGGLTGGGAPTASAVADKVWSQFGSMVGTGTSQLFSYVSDTLSNLASRITKEVAYKSQVSDLTSDLRSYLVIMSGILSDTYSAVSDLRSYVLVGQSDVLSNIYSATLQGNSRLLALSDAVSDVGSDLRSLLTTTGVALTATARTAVASRVWSNTMGTRVDSRVLLTTNTVSDLGSKLLILSDVLSDFYSDFQSRVPKLVATNSQVSDLVSDVRSFLVGISGMLSDTYSLVTAAHSDLKSAVGTIAVTMTPSDVSNIASAVQQALTPTLGDIYSLLGDVENDVSILAGNELVTYEAVSHLQDTFDSRLPAFIPELASDPGPTPTWAQVHALYYAWLKNNNKSTNTKRYVMDSAGTPILSAVLAEDTDSFVQGVLG